MTSTDEMIDLSEWDNRPLVTMYAHPKPPPVVLILPTVLAKLVACARVLEHYRGVPCPRVDHDQCAHLALRGLVDSAAPRATPEGG